MMSRQDDWEVVRVRWNNERPQGTGEKDTFAPSPL